MSAIIRNTKSHKGQNGRVLVIGGSALYHGAPILAGLAAEKSGVDLVYLMVPKNQQYLARGFSVNLIVDTFSGRVLQGLDIRKAVEWTRKADVLVIGNGLGEKPQTLRACRKIMQQSTCSLVVDASALIAFADLKNREAFHGRDIVLTPHRGELGRMLKRDLKTLSDEEIQTLIRKESQAWGVTMVLKGAEDIIAGRNGEFFINRTGHPVMTKGGTGDLLAGLIGGLMAQGLSGFEAVKEACEHWGKIGEYLVKEKGLMVTLEEMMGSFEPLHQR